jgi:hypothetical protein
MLSRAEQESLSLTGTPPPEAPDCIEQQGHDRDEDHGLPARQGRDNLPIDISSPYEGNWQAAVPAGASGSCRELADGRGVMRAALYARVSTFDQEPENQLAELRRYVAARGWTAVEYIDKGVSGAKDRRPSLDQVLGDARRRRVDVVVCWRLDRLGRNLKHLVTLLEELQALGIAFVSLK